MESHWNCNTHIWFHHTNPQLIKQLHKKHKKEPFKPTLEWGDYLHVNHTGCDFDGLPPFPRETLERLKAIQGSSKNKIVTGSINFTEFRSKDKYC